MPEYPNMVSDSLIHRARPGTAQPEKKRTGASIDVRSRARSDHSEIVNRDVDQQQRSGRTGSRDDPGAQRTAVASRGRRLLRRTDGSRIHPRGRFVSHKVPPNRLVDRSLDRVLRLRLPRLGLRRA